MHKRRLIGLREAELEGKKIGTTKRGIGPALCLRPMASVQDLKNPVFNEKFQKPPTTPRSASGSILSDIDADARLHPLR
jgi:adenylosuccinate synthase